MGATIPVQCLECEFAADVDPQLPHVDNLALVRYCKKLGGALPNMPKGEQTPCPEFNRALAEALAERSRGPS